VGLRKEMKKIYTRRERTMKLSLPPQHQMLLEPTPDARPNKNRVLRLNPKLFPLSKIWIQNTPKNFVKNFCKKFKNESCI
jgi:hypothetical protein